MEIDIGEGYAIRSFVPSDRDAIVRYANNRKVWLGLRDLFPYPYTPENADAWLAHVKDLDPETHYAIASPTECVGGIGFTIKPDINRLSAEIGYWLGEPFWGRGISTRAVEAVTEYAFSNFDLVRVYAEVFSSNGASIRVLERAGYVYEGRLRKYVIKDGEILDMLIYAVVR
jgi:ribosomal-protein-alanine N-acetyltransferase